MNPPTNTNDLGEVRLRLRDDLEFSLQHYGGQACYVVHDPLNSGFYRIGIPEYTFLSLLDGHTTLREAIGQTAAVLGADAFSEQEAAAICKWLTDCQLATTDHSVDAGRLLDVADRAARRSRWQWINPLMVKLPLGNPEPIVDRLAPWFGWLTSGPAFFAWLALCGVALHQLSGRWGELSLTANLVLSRGNWIWLVVTWLVLKLLHELAHALMCRRFGGAVREAGVMFILFAPLPYVDVTSAWRFPSKWPRIATSAAGMYVELLIAAVAAIVWCQADSAVLRHHAYHVMLTASFITVLFNANFLMRFDGYYILADLLEIPNLYTLGQQYLLYLGRRYALGVPAQPPRWPLHKAAIVRVYGVASFAWRLLVCIGLVIAADALFAGAGVALAALAVVLWLGFPLARFARYLVKGNRQEQPRLVRFALVSSAAATMGFLLFTGVPWPWRISAPAVVRYASPSIVRTETDGFVEQIHVQPGDVVRAGQVLVTLRNRQLELDRQDLDVAIAQACLRSRTYHRQGKVAAYQAEEKTRLALEAQARQKQQELDSLVVRAGVDGQIVQLDPEPLRGRYVSRGASLLVIADEGRKELSLSIDQDDGRHFIEAQGRPLSAFIPTWHTTAVMGRLEQVEPRASTDILLPEQAATHGGTLEVKAARPSTDSTGPAWSHLAPRFSGRVALTSTQSQKLHAGQRGTVVLDEHRGTLGHVLTAHIRDWLHERMRAVR